MLMTGCSDDGITQPQVFNSVLECLCSRAILGGEANKQERKKKQVKLKVQFQKNLKCMSDFLSIEEVETSRISNCFKMSRPPRWLANVGPQGPSMLYVCIEMPQMFTLEHQEVNMCFRL